MCVLAHVWSCPVFFPAAYGTTKDAPWLQLFLWSSYRSHEATWPLKNYRCNIRNQSRVQDCTFSLSQLLSLPMENALLLKRLTTTLLEIQDKWLKTFDSMPMASAILPNNFMLTVEACYHKQMYLMLQNMPRIQFVNFFVDQNTAILLLSLYWWCLIFLGRPTGISN